MKNNKGFSLIEILVVMTIMAVFATIASNAIKTALMNKKKIDARLRIESRVFDALRIMATDLEKAFHYKNPFYEIERNALITANQAQNNNNQNNQNNNPQNPQQVQIPPRPPILTQFIGKEQSIHFTTLNHFRSVANSQESDQIEVGYFLKNCRSRGNKDGESSQCLWRRTAITIDDEVDKDGKDVVLIENVETFKLEYLSEDINLKEWKSTWQSDRNGDADTRGKFPSLVKITLAIEDPQKAIGIFKQTVIANLRFPNNEDPAKTFQSVNNPNQQNQQNPPNNQNPQNPPGSP